MSGDTDKKNAGDGGQKEPRYLRFRPDWAPQSWSGVVGLVQLILHMREVLGPGGSTLVELGSACGESGSMFAGSGLFRKVWLVDFWRDELQYECARRNLGRYPAAQMVRGDVYEVAAGWDKGQVDALYLDAGHTYEQTLRALREWDPILKDGGLWSGHDYNPTAWPGVVRAVDEFFEGRQLVHFDDLSWAVVKRGDVSYPLDYGAGEAGGLEAGDDIYKVGE